MSAEELGQIFENNFDCYAGVDKTKACLPNWYEDKDTMAMTKEKFIEVVTKIACDGKNVDASEKRSINYDTVLGTVVCPNCKAKHNNGTAYCSTCIDNYYKSMGL